MLTATAQPTAQAWEHGILLIAAEWAAPAKFWPPAHTKTLTDSLGWERLKG